MCQYGALRVLLFVEGFFLWTAAFNKAPGRLTIQIGYPDLSESCTAEVCHFSLDLCIGSGRIPSERCSWSNITSYNGSYSEGRDFILQPSFMIDDIRSILYLNAKFTIHIGKNRPQIVQFEDSLVQYSVYSGPHRTSLHSKNYVSMAIEISVECQSHYYPPFYCTRYCMGDPGRYSCDSNGTIVCVKGYVFVEPRGQCVKDLCASNGTLCQNNSTCVNDGNSVKCDCPKGYTGPSCQVWDPCKDHKCQHSGRCVRRPKKAGYVCQCTDRYYGPYCENIDDPCMEKVCLPGLICQRRQNEAFCYTPVIADPKTNPPIRLTSLKTKKISTKTYLVTSTEASSTSTVTLTRGEDTIKETVKLVQYPVQDVTTMVIIIVLLVVMICCFGVSFWIHRDKYFMKKKNVPYYPYYPPLPSIISLPQFKGSSDNIKRWHSMDDGDFSMWQQQRFDQFSAMYLNQGYNSCMRPESTMEAQRGHPRNPRSMLRPTQSVIHKSSDLRDQVEDHPLDAETTMNTITL